MYASDVDVLHVNLTTLTLPLLLVHCTPHSHYKVIAVPVTRDGDQPRTIPFKPVVPLPQLLNHTLSQKLVEKVVERAPFFVGEYQSGELPPTLKIAGRWVQRAFKMDTHYSFVVVAFTKVCSAALWFLDVTL